MLVLLSGPGAFAAERYDPRLRFRTLRTQHFDIYFHQREEALARRLGLIAEEVADRLERELGRPSSRVRVILVDQGDLANGWATPVPYDLIEIQAVPPRAESTIGNTDDWLRLVFAHEYTHVVHLDRSRGWIGGLRSVFGRLPVLYPNIFLPQWQIEGIATYQETALTGQGRVQAGDFRMLVDRAATTGRFLPLDRASGGLVDWPSGTAPYLYGAFFHEYLARQYGAEKIAQLADETARRIPYLGTRAFKKVFGRPLGTLWREFEADAIARAGDEATSTTRITTHGFNVSAPRFDAAGGVYYAVASPHDFPALMHVVPGRPPRKVTARYLGNRTSVSGGSVVFDQLELVRNVGLQSDVYALSIADRRTVRLTREARAADPDVAPDGRTIVCTVQETGRRSLATFSMPAPGALATPVTLVAEAETEFSSPRWSPDGRRIVAERRRLGGPSEIVLIDAATRATRTLVTSRGRNVAPAWADEGRTVLFAADRDSEGFRILAVDVETGTVRRLAGTGSGAESPTLSPDGRTLVFVGYTPGGHDLFSIPYERAAWEPVALEAIEAAEAAPRASETIDTLPATSPYSPWQTLAPTFWTPVVASDSGEFVGGAATGGVDALGRHGYYASAAWSASRARPDWTVAYAYDRWWPTLYADLSEDTDPWRAGELRSLELNAGAVFPVQRVRWRQAALAAWHASTDFFDCESCSPVIDTTLKRRAVRFGWLFSSAKSFGYSVSAETGTALGANAEFTSDALGADGDATAFTLDARQYVRAWPRHAVIAARIAGAWSGGDEPARRTFSAAGNGPQPGGFAIDTDAIGLMRGYDESDVAGSRAAVANLDYRFPIASLQRGAGTFPLFIRTVHAALFADVGNGWNGTFKAADLRKSFGAELSADVVLGYALPVSLTAGVAVRDDRARRDVVGFARIGRAF